MANLQLEQQPKFDPFPAAQPTIFTVSDSTVVINQSQVKFIANVYVHNDISSIASYKVATLKTTPNNTGVGMFDLRSVIESFVNTDNLASGNTSSTAPVWATAPTYKGASYTTEKPFPIHLIDNYSFNDNTIRWLTIKFEIEYLNGGGDPNKVETDGDTLWTPNYLFYNGYLAHTDALRGSTLSNNFGWDLEKAGTDIVGNEYNFIQNSSTSCYLSTMPTTLYAREQDYGTLATFNGLTNASFETGNTNDPAKRYFFTRIIMYNSSGIQIATFTIDNNVANGGSASNITDNSNAKILFNGIYPANLINGSTTFSSNFANTSYYTFQGFDNVSSAITKLYTVNIICNNDFGYEGIRLAWLNKFGAFDYYTFNTKSVRSVSTKKTQYTQLEGSWNNLTYLPQGYKGGMKNFRVNAKEKIKLSTDFLSDLESVWIEGLLNSPEVYIINKSTANDNGGIINKYVEPVIVTTSSFTRKTVANDKIISYTIDIEKNKDLRTQSV